MNPLTPAVTLAAVAFFAVAGYGLQAAMSTPPTLMSPDEYGSALRSIEKSARAALGRCRAGTEASRGLCRSRARAQARIAKAELDARYYGTVQAQAHAQDVRARVRFDMTRDECIARGVDRARCLSEARTEQAKALAAAKLAAS
ncbi:MAG TPA: hypothetical protein VLS49_15625 [Usitatibacter sp.]|nr:hypothetical protein [Usitatibacter sp.]